MAKPPTRKDMNDDQEYQFSIDAFTPDVIPMRRLAEYMASLAKLFGHEKSVHFQRIEKGSAVLVTRVEHNDYPKVQDRLRNITAGQLPEGIRAFKELNDKLAADNAIGKLSGPAGTTIINFPGRERPKTLEYGAVKQLGTLEGQVVSVGGVDKTAHIKLQDSADVHTGCECTREVARELAKHLYGQTVRVSGVGRWLRSAEGNWELLRFKIDNFELLDDAPLREVVAKLRDVKSVDGNDANAAYLELVSFRTEGEDMH